MDNEYLTTGILMGFDDDIEVGCIDEDGVEHEIIDYEHAGDGKINLVLKRIEKEEEESV